jgi:hypothetical protein
VTIQIATDVPLDREPAPRPTRVDQAEYKTTRCPLCYQPLQQRIRGQWCARDKGWLVEEMRGGELRYSLWQGSS